MKKDLDYYKRSTEELNMIFELAFDEITITDGKGIFLRGSRSCFDNIGLNERELVGASAYDLENKGVFSKSSTVMVLEQKKEVTLIQETLAKKKLLVNAKPMFDENGEIIRVINMSKDITEIEGLRKQVIDSEKLIDKMREQLYKKNVESDEKIIGTSIAMNKIINLIKHIAKLDTTILLLGETGVGKSILANKIHSYSNKSNEKFVQINCGSIPDTLIESELFGYAEGSFTGANKNGKKGLFEIVGNGTIFLDEIGELPIKLQVKLLQVLQEKNFYRIGDSTPVEFKGRVISATNRNLQELVRKGEFREDLYYRLNVVPIYIPALRERKDDIPLLIKYFLDKFNLKYGINKAIANDAFDKLINYQWPGNVRELENMVERSVVTTIDNTIKKDDLIFISQSESKNNSMVYVDELGSLKEMKEKLEKHIFTIAKEKYVTTRKIAEVLEIDQSTVVKKMKKLNLS